MITWLPDELVKELERIRQEHASGSVTLHFDRGNPVKVESAVSVKVAKPM